MTPPTRATFVNGKFCAQRTTGVQRYAHNLLIALDACLAASGRGAGWTLLVPPAADPPALRAVGVRRVHWGGPGGLHGWEQMALPAAVRGGCLVNLAGTAPAFGVRSQVCVLHDAAPFDEPRSHSRPFGAWYRWLFRRLAHRAGTRLVTVSAFSRHRLGVVLGLPESRLALAPGGAEHLERVAADSRLLVERGLDRQPFLLAVGSRNPGKNLARLIEAWKTLARPDLRLVLVGGANPRVFRAEAVDASAAGVVDLGSVDDPTLKALYQQALALVFPSLYEGFGLPPLEAMACGCPVAAARIPALQETCGDAVLGFDPLATDDIASALRRLADQPGLRAELRERGRRRAAAYTWSAAASTMIGLLEAAA